MRMHYAKPDLLVSVKAFEVLLWGDCWQVLDSKGRAPDAVED